MTAVVGLVEKKKLYIGADSAATDGRHGQSLLADAKVFDNGPMLFGVAGSLRMAQLVHYTLKIPKHDSDLDVTRFMATAFIDAVRKVLLDGGHAFKAHNEEMQGGEFLVGYLGRLYHVQEDLAIIESTGPFSAIGSGGDLALGAMHVLYGTKKKAGDKIARALTAAAAFNASVRPPFSVGILG